MTAGSAVMATGAMAGLTALIIAGKAVFSTGTHVRDNFPMIVLMTGGIATAGMLCFFSGRYIFRTGKEIQRYKGVNFLPSLFIFTALDA